MSPIFGHQKSGMAFVGQHPPTIHSQKITIKAVTMVGFTAAFTAAIVILSGSSSVYAFSTTFGKSLGSFHSTFLPTFCRTLPALDAKAAKRKQKKKKATAPVSSSGGFGKTSEVTVAKKENDDFAAFPALEPSVQETILAYDGDVTEQGEELPNEAYQRLDQIYGFHNFNYLEEEEEEPQEATSFGDLLSASPAASDKPITEMSDLLKPTASNDLSDLFGGTTEPTESTKETMYLSCLSSLPPFTEFHVLHMDPLVIGIDNFFTDEECDRYVNMSLAPSKDSASAPEMTRSKTVGKDANAKAQRTSTTWFHHFKDVPELISKAARLIGLDDIKSFEEPQTVR